MNSLISKTIGALILILGIWMLVSWLTPDKIDVKPAHSEAKEQSKEADKLKKEIKDHGKTEPVAPIIDDFPVIELQPDRQLADENANEAEQNGPFAYSISEGIERAGQEVGERHSYIEQQPEADTLSYPQPCSVNVPDQTKDWECDYLIGEWK